LKDRFLANVLPLPSSARSSKRILMLSLGEFAFGGTDKFHSLLVYFSHQSRPDRKQIYFLNST
jgi:hypothetical protein